MSDETFINEQLQIIIRAWFGYEASPAIYELMKLANQNEAEKELDRIGLNTEFYDFIRNETESSEVITARAGHTLLHLFLDKIERTIEAYEALYNITPLPDDIENYTSVTLNIVEGG